MQILIHSSFNLEELDTEKKDKILDQFHEGHEWHGVLANKISDHGILNNVEINLELDDNDVYDVISIKALVHIDENKNTAKLRQDIHDKVKEALLADSAIQQYTFEDTVAKKDFPKP